MHQALYNIENGFSSQSGVNIFFTAPWHSVRSTCKPSYTVGTPKYIAAEGFAVLKGVCKNNSLLLKILSKSKIIMLTKRALLDESSQVKNDDFELYIAILRSITKKKHENGSKLIIACIKGREKEFKNTDWTNESLMQELEIIADIFIDVTLSKTREELDSSFYIHKLGPHPSAWENAARAKLTFSAIKNELREIK